MATTAVLPDSLLVGTSPLPELWNLTENFTNSEAAAGGRPDWWMTLKKTQDVILVVTQIFIMTAVGLACDLKVMWANLKKPKGILIGVTSQFVFMPLLAWSLCQLFQLPPKQALALMVVGSSPGGSMSNMYSLWCRGCVSLSVCMTSVSTIVAMGAMPGNILLYSPTFTRGTDIKFAVPVKEICAILALLMIPVAAGLAIKWKFPKVVSLLLKVGNICGMLAIALSIIFTSIMFPGIYLSPWQLVLTCALLPLSGLLMGFFFSSVFCMTQAERRTVALETGCQNVPLSFTVAVLTFPLSWLEDLTTPILIFGAASLLEFIGMSLAITMHHKYVSMRRTAGEGPDDAVGAGDTKAAKVTESRKELAANMALPPPPEANV